MASHAKISVAQATKCILLILVTFTCGAALFSCAESSKPTEQRVIAVASIYPVYDWVRQIGGERVEVHCLVPSGASPHTFSITPEAMRLVAQARLFFRIGRGLEVWADKISDAASSSLQVITLSDGLTSLFLHPMNSSTHSDEEHPADSTTEHHEHAGADPHVWLDPILAKDMVRKIASALSTVDPSGKLYYEHNLEAYLAELTSLDMEIRAAVSQFADKSFVAFHSAFLYFANRYGLKQAAVIEEFPGKDPSITYLRHVVEILKEARIRTVLAEPQLNDKIAQTVAHEVKAQLVYVDPLGNAYDPQRDTYIKLMRYNLRQLSKALNE